jgi:hypothetical protein
MNIEPGLYEDTREDGVYRTDGEVLIRDGMPFGVFYATFESDPEDAYTLIDENRFRFMRKLSQSSGDSVLYSQDLVPENRKEIYQLACSLPDSTRLRFETMGVLKHAIKEGVFLNKIGFSDGEICIRGKEFIGNAVMDFYSAGEKSRSLPSDNTLFFYRGVKVSPSYNPGEWQVGETFSQVLPFSTSAVPEFSMDWAGSQCCFFKVNVRVNENFFFICADNLSNPVGDSQMEAALPPGELTVEDKFIVEYKGVSKVFLELDYIPWSSERWEEAFGKLENCPL